MDLIDFGIFTIGLIVFTIYHEKSHKIIYEKAEAKPRFIYRFPLYFDYIPTEMPKQLSKAEEMQCLTEIIGYHLLGSLFMALCILIIIFK